MTNKMGLHSCHMTKMHHDTVRLLFILDTVNGSLAIYWIQHTGCILYCAPGLYTIDNHNKDKHIKR